MRTSYLALGVGLFLATAIAADLYFEPDTAPPLPPAGPIPLDCERVCLQGLVDEYVSAVVAHDPGALPLSEDVRFSENSQLLDLGDAFWKTATGRGAYGYYFSDPAMGQAAYLGIMEESGRPVMFTLRLRVELGRITEIETSVSRQGRDSFVGDLGVGIEPVWVETIPPSERLSRQELVALANSWYEALEEPRAQLDHFTPDCQRTDNGVSRLPCEQIESPEPVTRVHQRRFPLVDEERGVVWSYSVFDRDGVVPEAAGDAAIVPSSLEVAAAFLLDGGRILRIETVSIPAPYHANSPWEGGLTGR